MGEELYQTINFFILQVAAMSIITFLLPKLKITNIFGLVGIVLSIALINTTIWDSELFYQLPDFTSSKGLALIALNGFIFYLLVKVLPGIEINGILPALIAPFAYSISTILIQTYAGDFDFINFASSSAEYLNEIKNYISSSPEDLNLQTDTLQTDALQ